MEQKIYFGCRVRQRGDENTTPFFIFNALVKDIKQWAEVRRTQDSPEGIQRLLRETRRKSITRFVKSDTKNTIPNNILLAFEEGVVKFNSLEEKVGECFGEQINIYNGCDEKLQWGTIEFSLNNKPCAYVVDGQHRLYGLSDYSSEDLPVLVVALLDATLEEQAFQFIVINNKAVKVSTNNVKAIIANLNEKQLQDRLLKAGVKYGNTSPTLRDINDLDTSPFKDLLDWPYNKEGQKLVPIAAIEQSIKYLKSVFTFLEEDEDSLVDIFCAMWQVIKDNYPELWAKDNTFMKKVNINALNEFISERLKYAWELDLVDVFESKKVKKHVLTIVKLLPKEFWEAEWSIRLQDSASVRNQIKEDLSNLVDNCKLRRSWEQDLKLPITNNEATN
ncbi:MAG: DGQHR domain-containing protein [Mastigocoleus sp. MO_167.B18]|uniref:DGQHR domain-containing protein n=1 Tax=Mastigocoleus sp. MO_188.B34 TaxID=3036635 RepID=UPI00262CE017|nr:DGQHR domain-containing protein [Mastigocoleus sp. MO_188.B34]MDJ0693338.1 DGQHR domain-containing protein [Mastigocoleus sp. MO_188.B34]MDJ0773178.1 DGQHR domain-containing protein [Mastigocoleus sp. MO_167.B18]